MKTKHSQDPDYQKILDMLRTAKPEGQTWKHFRRQFLSKQKAWQEDAPTVEDMRRILTRHPDTTFLCVSREAAGRVNELSLNAKFPRREPLATVPGDVESHAANYNKNGKLKKELVSMPVPIHVGMQVWCTRKCSRQ
jgi:hypothetical protein